MSSMNAIKQELNIEADANKLCDVRKFVKEVIESFGCCEETSNKIILAVNEACMNVIQHAYKESEQGKMLLQIEKKGSLLIFRLNDFAKPVDIECIKPRDLDEIRPGGLGTFFITEIMDECERGHLDEGEGNYLIMKKEIS